MDFWCINQECDATSTPPPLPAMQFLNSLVFPNKSFLRIFKIHCTACLVVSRTGNPSTHLITSDLRPQNHFRKQCKSFLKTQSLKMLMTSHQVPTLSDHPQTETNSFLFKLTCWKFPHLLAFHAHLSPQAAKLKLMHLTTLNSSAVPRLD